jgi:antitoxin (DNA-binding transcriptional repressor) of toxin-antitoxin stability system
MRSASVATFEQNPLGVLDWAENGEEVVILREGQLIARLLPAGEATVVPRLTGEEIANYWREVHCPVGHMSDINGTDLVAWARGGE